MNLLDSLHFLALTVMLGAAVSTDLRERRIPNGITVFGFLAGLALGIFVEGGFPLLALSGSALAMLIALPFLALGGIGGGDAKLLIAVGAFVGPGGLLSVVLYGAVAGGVLAIGSAIRRGALVPVFVSSGKLFLSLASLGSRGDRLSLSSPGAHSIPYGLAIAAGTLVAWFFPLSLGGLLQ